MNICQHPIMFAVGDDAAAVGALSRRSNLSRGTAVGAVGDDVAFLAWVGLEASLAVEDHLVFHEPVAVRVALEYLLGGVVDDIVTHHCVEPHGENFLVAVLLERMQRAVLDGDFLHHVGLALADVFVELLFVLVEEVLTLKRADDLPVF